MLRELYESYDIALVVCKTHSVDTIHASNIAYLAFFYGAVGDVSKSILSSRLGSKFNESFLNDLFKNFEERRQSVDKNAFHYKIFDGHQSRLGHYYRHLFQSVNYINAQNTETLSYIEKYQYIKTMRAQLSTQEQMLLFWNSVSDIGMDWEKGSKVVLDNDKLITKYNLIKNIPDGYSKYISPRKYYPLVEYEGLEQKPVGRASLEARYC